jgi:hypothetical protein
LYKYEICPDLEDLPPTISHIFIFSPCKGFYFLENLFEFKVTTVFSIRGVPLDDEDKTELHLEDV